MATRRRCMLWSRCTAGAAWCAAMTGGGTASAAGAACGTARWRLEQARWGGEGEGKGGWRMCDCSYRAAACAPAQRYRMHLQSALCRCRRCQALPAPAQPTWPCVTSPPPAGHGSDAAVSAIVQCDDTGLVSASADGSIRATRIEGPPFEVAQRAAVQAHGGGECKRGRWSRSSGSADRCCWEQPRPGCRGRHCGSAEESLTSAPPPLANPQALVCAWR